MIYFEDSIFPIPADPDSFFATSDKITLFSFKSTYLLSEVDELKINPNHVFDKQKGIVLGQSKESDILYEVK